MPKKLTYQFVKKYIESYNYKLISDSYINSSSLLTIKCSCGHIYKTTYGNFYQGKRCYKCKNKTPINKLTTKQFIQKAKQVHGGKYDYILVDYKNNYTKVKIICSIHGTFEQRPKNHLNGQGCSKCSRIKVSESKRKNTQQFIKESKLIHGDKYDYSLVQYKNCTSKVKIICPIHGVFEQTPTKHLNKHGCSECVNQHLNGLYYKNNIPIYNTYAKQLKPYGIKCRRSLSDKNILEVQCMYCGKWYQPSVIHVANKIQCIRGVGSGDGNLYCSNECKQACPTYGQKKYPKGFKTDTSREVQPHLRKLVLKRDNYTCQKCESNDKELHCHHITGIEVNPVESADIDNCITLCIDCHHEVHKQPECNMKRRKC